MSPYNLIFVGLSILGISAYLWFLSNKVENLENKNIILTNQLNTVININTELNENINRINKEYLNQMDILNTTLDKKDEVKIEIEKLKRKVKDEDKNVINTANDILYRMQQTAGYNNKSKN